jgi:hypothetical protein
MGKSWVRVGILASFLFSFPAGAQTSRVYIPRAALIDAGIHLPDAVFREARADVYLARVLYQILDLQNRPDRNAVKRTADVIWANVWKSPYNYNRGLALLSSVYESTSDPRFLMPVRRELTKRYVRFRWARTAVIGGVTLAGGWAGFAAAGAVGSGWVMSMQALTAGGAEAVAVTAITTTGLSAGAAAGGALGFIGTKKLVFSVWAVHPDSFFKKRTA